MSGSDPRSSLFLDTEFSGLRQHARLISLALIAADGRAFYAELTDWDQGEVDPWVRRHVIPRCWWLARPGAGPGTDPRCAGGSSEPAIADLRLHCSLGNAAEVSTALRHWLSQWPAVRIHADCPAYDWVLFCELFGGARSVPAQVHYLPMDLATLLYARGLDPDTDRYAFAGLAGGRQHAHHALWDALALRACWERLTAGQ